MGILDRFTGSARDRFAAEVLRIARRTEGVADARYDAEKFALAVRHPGQDSPVWIYLSNVYGESTGASKAERRLLIERLLRVMAAPHEEQPWSSARARLRPVLRAATFGQGGVAGMVPPISRAALPYLREFVVIDQPESMAYVAPPRLDEWGVGADEVFAAARDNLEILARRSLGDRPPDDNALVKMIDTGDAYFTSLLLAPGWLAEMTRRMGGPTVAFVADTNSVVLCRIPAAGLGGLYKVVEAEYGEAARSLSPVGYVANDRGEVVPYGPPVGHPDHVAARRAAAVLAATEYRTQARWLNEQYRRAGIDVLVGELSVVAGPGEAPVTVATWTDGITSLLPEAQVVSFVGERGAGPHVAWHLVAELVDLRPEPLLAPIRYRVGGWPPPDVMRELSARAVE